MVKIYNFKYSKSSEKSAMMFISFFNNLGFPIIMFFLVAFGMSLSGITKHLTVEIMMALLSVAILLGIIFAFKYCFGFKGVILYDNYMEITTQVLGFGKNKPKFKINYSEIQNVFNSTYNLRYDRRKARQSFIAGDYTYYVELTLKGGKQFCFSVDKQIEFIDELLNRIES